MKKEEEGYPQSKGVTWLLPVEPMQEASFCVIIDKWRWN